MKQERKKDIFVQTVLRRDTTPRGAEWAYKCYTTLTVWLPLDPRVKVGTVLTLKGDEKNHKWTVYSQGARNEIRLINRRWNVGGLA